MLNQIQKKPKKISTGVYLEEDIYLKVVDLGEREDVSTNEAMVQLIKIGLNVVDHNK